jgi:capsular exopolysaccharide synthesis family protein
MRKETVVGEDRPTGVSGDVRFLEDGVIRARKGVPILDNLQDPHSVVGEELRLLRAKLQRLCQPRQLKCIAVTSALPGEGKSTISVGLAAALSRESGRRVLLIEADLRRPTISEALGLPPAPGVGEWLEGGLDQIPIRRIETGGFFLLVAGQVSLERPELLASPLMEAVLRSARGAFDFVLLDATPVLPVADTILLQDLVDGFLLVARSRLTPREAILEALGRLAPDKVLGVVLNDHREYKHSYRAHAYERYGMVYGQTPESGRRPGPKTRN